MRTCLRVAALMIPLMLGIPAVAQEPEAAEKAGPTIVYGIRPSPGACTSENTTAVTFADLLRDKAAYNDQCVSTVAWISDRALFLDRDDLNLQNSNSNDEAADRRVGLYADEKTQTAIWNTNTTRARIVGKLLDCSDLNGPNVMMVMGYCHYTDGPIIAVSSFSPLR